VFAGTSVITLASVGKLVAEADEEDLSAGVQALLNLLAVGMGWVYFAWMESSKKQATLGKMLLGMQVTDERRERITMRRATGRYFAEILSVLTLGIGYLMVLWDDDRQALHDKVAGTLVVRGRARW
jgi:uncharacterized RDD family membrane protein YckC